MRTCGECTLCCKLPGVYTAPEQEPALAKPAGKWCQHCKPGAGCQIYEGRPAPCHNFECLWLVHPEMPEDLRPDRSHVIMYGTTDEDRAQFECDVVVMEDPAYLRLNESLQRPAIAKQVKTMMDAGLKILIVCGKDDRSLVMKRSQYENRSR